MSLWVDLVGFAGGKQRIRNSADFSAPRIFNQIIVDIQYTAF